MNTKEIQSVISELRAEKHMRQEERDSTNYTDLHEEYADRLESAIAASVEGREAVATCAQLPQSVYDLARRCLHIAFVWNDHNFPAAHVMARKEAERYGIRDFEMANAWLDAPEEWPVAKPEPLPSDPCGLAEGFVVVPREPTPEMLRPFASITVAARGESPDEPMPPHGEYPRWYEDCGPMATAYAAMLAAAPGAGEEG